jgi:hypothetical protein
MNFFFERLKKKKFKKKEKEKMRKLKSKRVPQTENYIKQNEKSWFLFFIFFSFLFYF